MILPIPLPGLLSPAAARKAPDPVQTDPNQSPLAMDDGGFKTVVGTPLYFSPVILLENDRDEPGDELSVVSVQEPTSGTVTMEGSVITFVPTQTGTQSFRYTVSDGKGGLGTATVRVDVSPLPNVAPIAAPDFGLTVTTGQVLVINASTLLANDFDADGDALTVVAVQNPTSGSVSMTGQTISYFAGSVGSQSFTYTASDGRGGTSTATVNVSVTSQPNRAPFLSPDGPMYASQGKALVIQASALLANDFDADGDVISVYSVQAPTTGTVSISGSTITFTPAAPGEHSFEYTVTDGRGTFSTSAVTVRVNANPAPASDSGYTIAAGSPIAFTAASLLANDFDADGDALTIASVQGATSGTVTLSGTNITFTPAQVGSQSFTYTVSDGKGGSGNATVTVNVVAAPTAPSAVADSDFSVVVGQPLVIPASRLLANDTDVNGDPLTLVSVQSASSGTVSLSGTDVTFTPSQTGSQTFTYTVSDGTGRTGTATVTVQVLETPNQAPSAVADGGYTMQQGGSLQIPATQLVSNDTDPDSDALAVSSVQSPSSGTVTLSSGTVTFTPAASAYGTQTFTYTASDGRGGTSTATVTVQVNRAPVAQQDSGFLIQQGQSFTASASSLVANDSDPDGDSVTLTSVKNPSSGTVTLNAGTVTFTPSSHGTQTFEYTVSDGKGGTGTGLVTVAVNRSPSAQPDSGFTMQQGQTLTISSATLTSNDSDLDGDTVTVASVQSPSSGTVSISGSTVSFAPTGSGTQTFTYTITDGRGGTSTSTVTVQVNAAPSPVADGPYHMQRGASIGIPVTSLLSNDTDANGDSLTLTSVQNPSSGTVTLSGGTVTFTPDAMASGTQTFQYTVSDGKGGTSTGTVTVEINRPPIASSDTGFSVVQGQTLTIQASELLANDTDADGDTLTVASVGSASSGTVSLSGTTVTYTPGAVGSQTFQYTVSDGQGGSATSTATVQVTAANQAPGAVADSFEMQQGTSRTFASSELLANDNDPDGGTLTITSAQAATTGTVTLSGGSVTFAPAAGASGNHSFAYTVSDGQGGTSTATVTVFINRKPVVGNDSSASYVINQGETFTVSTSELLANDADPDSHTLTVSSVQSPSSGTVSLSGGTVSFTPSASSSGNQTFTYTASDGHGGTAVGTVTVKVNRKPVAGADSGLEMQQGGALVIPWATLLANDSDPDGSTVTVWSVGSASSGTVTMDSTAKTVTFTPASSAWGNQTFQYSAWDGTAGSASAPATVTVFVNRPPVAAGDGPYEIQEGQTFQVSETALTANDTDTDGHSLSVVSVQSASTGTVSRSAGTVTFAPTGTGTQTFTYTVSDGHGGTSTATVNVLVHPNQPPVAVSDSGYTTTVNQPIVIAESALMANDSDPEGSALTFVSVQAASSGTVTRSGGNVTFTPTSTGNQTFTYTIRDNKSNTATATVTVAVNPAPSGATSADNGTVSADSNAVSADAA